MPVAGPALVHDLGPALGREVVGLFADDPQDVALPVWKRRVFQQEKQNVFLGPDREALIFFALVIQPLRLGLQQRRRVDVVLHVLFGGESARLFAATGLAAIGIVELVTPAAFDVGRVVIDQVVQ